MQQIATKEYQLKGLQDKYDHKYGEAVGLEAFIEYGEKQIRRQEKDHREVMARIGVELKQLKTDLQKRTEMLLQRETKI